MDHIFDFVALKSKTAVRFSTKNELNTESFSSDQVVTVLKRSGCSRVIRKVVPKKTIHSVYFQSRTCSERSFMKLFLKLKSKR